jgi:diadenosine tetraphosphate (Ap4A) HIT family hydrolase
MRDTPGMPTFTLHPRLAADSHLAADWPLCRLLLSGDATYPWFILVPRRPEMREIYQLEAADQQQLLRESVILGQAMMQAFAGHKLNVAALGNVVPQLHLHHVVRYETDPAWPGPMFGRAPPQPYAPEARAARLAALAAALPPDLPLKDYAP